jgi:hypothetical protein
MEHFERVYYIIIQLLNEQIYRMLITSQVKSYCLLFHHNIANKLLQTKLNEICVLFNLIETCGVSESERSPESILPIFSIL